MRLRVTNMFGPPYRVGRFEGSAPAMNVSVIFKPRVGPSSSQSLAER